VWRRTLISAWIAQTAAIMGFTFVMPFLRLYLRDELGLTDDTSRAIWSGYIFGAPGFIMGFAAPMWGILADRVGRKLMVMRAMFGGAIIVTLMGVATSPTHILILRMCQGALTGTITASAALVSSVSPTDKAGFSMGMMQAAIFAGNAVGPVVGGLASDHLGPRPPFCIAGGLLLVAGVLITAFATEGRSHPRESSGRGQTFGEILRRPGFIGILSLLFVMRLSRAFPGVIFQEYVETLVGEGGDVNTVAGLMLAVMFATASITSMLMGRLADRVGYAPLMVAGTVAGGVICFPQAWVSALWQLFVLRILLGVAAGTIGPAMGKFVHASFPRSSHGRAFGIVQSANSLSWAIGPLAGGFVNAAFIPHFGSEAALRLPFAVAGVFQFVVGFLAWGALARLPRPEVGCAPDENP
jgi:DHA1 family multidrug resistance protein-like MFS transporter